MAASRVSRLAESDRDQEAELLEPDDESGSDFPAFSASTLALIWSTGTSPVARAATVPSGFTSTK